MKPVVLIDTNVVIDLLASREPNCFSAAAVFDLAEQEKINAYVNVLTLVTVYYILHAHYKVAHDSIMEKFAVTN
ncbi:PIN domain-containing protein [Fibrisoma montanum]|uniref:PIN domain-containing protein n=1 Tax=Fibrisoma montanum TaxID=2305895 RepID=A0A418MC00_9BACT|nr:PIN domain-containing protein [Fibrisoma montanum]RIV23889.1 PIN domain-containing protein [Fibrisoma montanum]